MAWPEATVRVSSTMRVDVRADHVDVHIALTAEEGPTVPRTTVRTREWRETIPR